MSQLRIEQHIVAGQYR